MEKNSSDLYQYPWCPLYGPLSSPSNFTESLCCAAITEAREIWYVTDSKPGYAIELLPPSWKVQAAASLSAFCEDILTKSPSCPDIFSIPVQSARNLWYQGKYRTKVSEDVLKLADDETLAVQAIIVAKFAITKRYNHVLAEKMFVLARDLLLLAQRHKAYILWKEENAVHEVDKIKLEELRIPAETHRGWKEKHQEGIDERHRPKAARDEAIFEIYNENGLKNKSHTAEHLNKNDKKKWKQDHILSIFPTISNKEIQKVILKMERQLEHQ